MNGKIVIRVGGGYMVIDEFIATYGEIEKNKIQQIKEAGGDPFATDEKGSPSRWTRSPGNRGGSNSPKERSPTGGTTVGGKRSPKGTFAF